MYLQSLWSLSSWYFNEIINELVPTDFICLSAYPLNSITLISQINIDRDKKNLKVEM